MAQLKTPDVYVKERSLLSPSVAEVPTAIPAFLGYTEITEDAKGESIVNKPIRLTSLLEYTAHFGGPYQESMEVVYKQDAEAFVVKKDPDAKFDLAKFFLYQSMAHFFANGGGTCYVVSVGGYDVSMKTKSEFSNAVQALKKIDEVTLISSPETVLLSAQEHYDVQNESLNHAESMMDRFALVDVKQNISGEDIGGDSFVMREKVTQGLKYGAAYYPYLMTSIPRSYDEAKVNVTLPPVYYTHVAGMTYFAYNADGDVVDLDYDGKVSGASSVYYAKYYGTFAPVSGSGETVTVDMQGFPVYTVGDEVDGDSSIVRGERKGTPQYAIFVDKDDATKMLNDKGYVIDNSSDDDNRKVTTETGDRAVRSETVMKTLADLEGFSTAYYNQVKAVLNKHYLYLPPSPAIAGAIAKTDAQRGVWKAPANVALAQVIAPSINIDNGEQEDLNVDVNAGKSINAIRSFVGKGSLIWGARTLDGNSNEWRYVPVRRLFNMVEESVKKASYFAVFEPNTPFTWLKIKTTIESYLENLWKQGALFGTSPDQAFFVNVGLGQTMSEDDINNGIMNIEIGLAAVRPAEFIVLTFSHKSIEG